MKRVLLFTVAISFVTAFIINAQTAEEIVSKHLQSVGVTKLDTVKTIIIEGKITGSQLKSGYIGYTVKKIRPYKQYMELNSGGDISKTIFDGRSEWAITRGKTVKNPFDVEEQRKRKICFEGDLFYCKNNGYQFEYKGIVKIEGLDFHSVRITNKDGYEAVYYIDPGSYMCMKSVEGDTETYYSNFKSVNGVTLPYSMRVASISASQVTELNIDTIEFNKAVDESLFVK